MAVGWAEFSGKVGQESALQFCSTLIEKARQGACLVADLHAIPQQYEVQQVLVAGVTTEVCVKTTVSEVDDGE
jgi:nicotinamidase-related amidase